MNGTAWTDAGKGATFADLANAANYPNMKLKDQETLRKHAFKGCHGGIFGHTCEEHWQRRSNLILTGAPIRPYDIERILIAG